MTIQNKVFDKNELMKIIDLHLKIFNENGKVLVKGISRFAYNY